MLKEINEIIKLAQETETEVYVVGGYLRDFLLKKKSLDIFYKYIGDIVKVLPISKTKRLGIIAL